MDEANALSLPCKEADQPHLYAVDVVTGSSELLEINNIGDMTPPTSNEFHEDCSRILPEKSSKTDSILSKLSKSATAVVTSSLENVSSRSGMLYGGLKEFSTVASEKIYSDVKAMSERISDTAALHKRPSWNTKFAAAVKILKMTAKCAPHNISLMRTLTDHGVPSWLPLLPSGVGSEKTKYPHGEWFFPKATGLQIRLNADPNIMHDGRYILYLHGGAFCCCNSATHRGLLYQMVHETQATVFSINYRRPPENPFPVPIDDCISAFLFILEKVGDAKRIILAGDSAGGNLVVSTLLRIHELGLPTPAGGILISPWVDLTDFKSPSWFKYAEIDYLDVELAKLFAKCYQGTCGNYSYHDLSPTFSDALHTLPPLLVEVGGCEVLHDQIVEFCKKVQFAGGNITCNVREDMVHVYPIYSFTEMQQCQDSFRAMVDFANELFQTVDSDESKILESSSTNQTKDKIDENDMGMASGGNVTAVPNGVETETVAIVEIACTDEGEAV